MAATMGSADMAEGGNAGVDREYQSLFWLPMMYQSVDTAVNIIENMLEDIDSFQDGLEKEKRGSGLSVATSKIAKKDRKKRQQILGDDSVGNEIVATRVETVYKSQDTEFLILSVLKSHFLFSRLQEYELQDVVDSMIDEYIEAGEDIIREGESGNKFYIMEEGEVDVFVKGAVVATLPSGVSFGDLALMYNCPRAATIRAKKDCTLWILEKQFFRQAMVTSSSNQTVNLSQFLGKLKLFESLSMEGLSQLSKSLTLKTYTNDSYIITQGEIGEHFYIIFKGRVRITKTLDDGSQIPLITLGEGNVFGERALIKKEPRAANVISDGSVECYSLASKDFTSMLGGIVEQMLDMNNLRVMRGMSVFKDLSDYRLGLIKGIMQNHEMFTGQRLLCDSLNLFVVMEGQVISPEGVIFKAGDVIGSLEEAADETSVSLSCKSEEAIVSLISRQALIGHLDAQAKGDPDEVAQVDSKDSKDTDAQADAEEKAKKDMESSLQTRKESYLKRKALFEGYTLDRSLENLEVVQSLGQGTFGNVYLARNSATGKDCALKVLDKKEITAASQTIYLRRECVALNLFCSPFLGYYYDVVISPSKVFFSLEYLPGAELWTYLYDEKYAERPRSACGGFTIQEISQFVAMIVLALEHIHGLGYCYRDLKPENVMLDARGYLKLVDFGFAKAVPYYNSTGQIQYRTFTLCGTPDYMAPEVVLTHGHDRSVDYWALGTLAYELMCATTPFEAPTTERIFEKIVRSQKFLHFPNHFDTHLKSFIRRLMHPNASLRLGALQNGFEDIKGHVLFSSASTAGATDFDGLMEGAVPAVFTPDIVSESSMTAEERFERSMKVDMESINLAEEASKEDELHADLFMDLYDIVEADFTELGNPLGSQDAPPGPADTLILDE